MKKFLALLLAAMMAATSFVGCSGSSGSSTPDASSAAGSSSEASSGSSAEATGGAGEITSDPVTLRFMWWGGDERNEATMKVIEQFQEMYPNVTIEAEYSGNEGYKDKLVTQLYGGNAADIVQTDPAWLGDIVSNGDYFVDLLQYADYFDISGFDAPMVKNFGVFDGKTIAVPTGGGGIALVYNKKLVDEIGLDLSIADEDWEGLVKLGEQVQAYDSSMYLINIDTLLVAQRFLRYHLNQRTNAPMIIDSELKMSFTREQLIETLTLIQKLYQSGTFQPASESAPYYNAQSTNPTWINGKVVGDFNYASNVMNDLTATTMDAEWIVDDMPMPADRVNDGSYSAPNQMISITNSSKNPEVAAKFLDYFYNDPTAIDTLSTVRGVPTIQAARDQLQGKGLIDPVVGEATEISSAHNGVKEHGLTTSTEVQDVLVDMVERVAYGSDPIEQIADDGIQQLQYILDDKQ